MLELLFQLKQKNRLSEHAYQFAKWIDSHQQDKNYSKTQKELAILLAALLAYHCIKGHSCIRLDSFLATNPFGLSSDNLDEELQTVLSNSTDLQKILKISPLEWQELLQDHIVFSNDPKQIAPILFQHNRIYLYRYWQAENRIAAKMKMMAQDEPIHAQEIELNKRILDRVFETDQNDQISWQKVAAATALAKKFCVISGGPGTGKTYTVVRLLAALQLKRLEQSQEPLTIALAAPTGKAAARLKESIEKDIDKLEIPTAVKQLIPSKASTIHSLLDIRPNSDIPKHNTDNPLHLDLLVVDEASMIDLFVMEKLFNALKPNTRLILLGDKDQLASVEAGNAMSELGDLLIQGYSENHSAYLSAATGYPIFSQNNLSTIGDSLCHLKVSRRFDESSGIGHLATAVNEKQAVNSWEKFAKFTDIEQIAYPSEKVEHTQWQKECVEQIVQKAVELYGDYLKLVNQRKQNPNAVSVSQIFETFAKVRFLSALRVGGFGVENLNLQIAEALRNAKLVSFKYARDSYIGKPILVTENAKQLKVFSGDIGLILPDEQGNARIYFETKINEQHLSLSPSRLPSFEPAYVMTVHKSQGSEFLHTLMVMPLTPSPVLTKELLYTAITRAREKFTLFGNQTIWESSVKRDIQRQSGLKTQLLTEQYEEN